ncbi:MAG: hypothetical protein H2057_00750 [Alphaproteobacteria bacterium]|nr:hypothetical protein [Alphaproteobacteria bacterium]
MTVSQARTPFSLQRLESVMLGHFEALPKALGYGVSVHQGIHLVKAGLGSSLFNIACGRLKVSAYLAVIKHYEG